MFLSQDSFEKYSLFGSFEKQLKFNEFNKNESHFEVLPFQNYTNNDIQWYNQLNQKLIDKEQKLKRPFQHHRYQHHHDDKKLPKKQPEQIQQQQQVLTKQKSTNDEPVVKVLEETKDKSIEYNPKSPQLIPQSAIEQPVTRSTSSIQTPKRDIEKFNEKTHPEKEKTNTPQNQIGESKSVRQKSPVISYDRRSNDLIKLFYPLKFKLAYPRVSRLKPAEQKEYLELHIKFKQRTKVTNNEVKFYKKYLHYKASVEKERQEFLIYLKDYYKNAKEDYDYMNPLICKYVDEMINYLESYSLSFDKYYSPLIELKINEHEILNQKCSFILEKHLVQIGNVPKIILPSITLDRQPFLTIDYSQISKRIPVAKNSKKLCKIPLSQDPNVEKLAVKYNCSIVMTSSSFVHLIYNLAMINTDDLELPVIIKNIQGSDKTVHKVIFIEKPFIQKYLSKREKNEKFYKRSLLTTLVKNTNMNTRARMEANKKILTRKDSVASEKSDLSVDMDKSFDSTSSSNKRKLEQTNNVDYESLNDLESFGCLGKSNTINTTLKPIVKTRSPQSKNQENKINLNTNSKIDPIEKMSSNTEVQIVNEIKPKTIKTAKNQSSAHNDSYDEYSEEDEENNLLIIDQKTDEVNTTNEISPSSPPQQALPQNIFEQINIKTLQQTIDNVPKSPSIESQHDEDLTFKPKIIPLNKPQIKPQEEEKKVSEKQEVKNVNEEEKLSLFDLISKMQEKLINTPLNTINPTHPTSSASASTKSQQIPTESAKDYVYIENIHDNVNYTLWSFNLNKQTIRILIRSSIDGYVNTETSSVNNIVLYPKLEYQPQFGCETLSIKDCCQMWSKSFLRNACDILLCRINTFTNKLISVTSFKHADILTSDCGFNPNQTFNHLRTLFEKLMNMETNNYLIKKQPNEPKLNLMKSEKSKQPGLFDLHFFYNGFKVVETDEKPSCWLPIDPELYLPYHHKLNRVPCLFDPVFDFSKKSSPEASKKTNRKKNYRKRQNKKAKLQ